MTNPYLVPGQKRSVVISHIQKAEMILEAVCESYILTKEELILKSRKQRFSEPRQVAMYLMKQHTKLTQNRIGMMFNRDHSTANYAMRTIAGRIEVDAPFKKKVASIFDIMDNLFTNAIHLQGIND